MPVTNASSDIKAGTVAWFAATTAPAGFIKANGAAVSRSTYAALFAAIGTTFGAGDGSTTFNVPDLRGEFPRGWDDGRGVDSGRGIGTAQGGQIESHGHGVNDPGHSHAFTGISGPGVVSRINASTITGDWSYANASGTGISIQLTGGTETRPRNVALLACIKY